MLAMNLLPGPSGTPLGLMILMVLLLGGSLWARNAARQRYSRGSAVQGEVESINSVRNGIIVRYNYTVDGQSHRGRFSATDLTALREVDRGDALLVFYEPSAPAQHIALLPGELDQANTL
ncbi:MAG TPA: DUF3592 domain-containing protein [Nannocystis exedens]|nr:DUF3592 domain-containing protein [Nannocystis exedens]